MDNMLQIEQAKQSLLDLKTKLDQIEKSKNNGINIFEASGMVVQEIKHSAFLAWLLDPNKPHGLGSAFLKKFLQSVLQYRSPNGEIVNSEVIEGALDNIEDILTDNELEVSTEKVLVDKESRIDILIVSPKAQKVIVIENKVFTGMHDDQLNRYENQVKKYPEYKKYKSVFIYLTPLCSLPFDNDWCVFDYGEVLRLIQEIHKELPRSNANLKLKILLEDYMELVDTNILNGNKELRALCKEIRRDYKDAIQILLNYTDNVEEVSQYCRKWLVNNYGVTVYWQTDKNFNFYTQSIKEYFERHGESLFTYDGICKCGNSVWVSDGPVFHACTLEKTRDTEWSEAQKKLMPIVMPNKKVGERYFRFNRHRLLSEDRREQPFDSIKPFLNKELNVLVEMLKKTDDICKNL